MRPHIHGQTLSRSDFGPHFGRENANPAEGQPIPMDCPDGLTGPWRATTRSAVATDILHGASAIDSL